MQGDVVKPRKGGGIYINKSTKVLVVACALLYLLGGVFHYMDKHMGGSLPIRLSSISYLAYCTICILSFIYTRKNLPQPITRRYMLVGISMLLAWEFIIMAEELIIPFGNIVNRGLWYLYYVPTLGIPNMLLFVALHYNRRPDDKVPRVWFLTLVPTILGILLVLTNDYHNIAFTFPDGIENFHLNYEYNIGYYVVMGWMFTLFVADILIMLYRARNQILGRGISLIFMSLGLSLIYFAWFISDTKVLSFVGDMYGVPEIFLGILVVAIAGCISNGLIRANFNFQELFESSNLGAVLVDAHGRIRYRSRDSINPTDGQMMDAIDHNIYIDKNTRFQGERITSGTVFWTDDLSSLNKLAEDLNETHEALEQDNSLISAENEMKSRRTKADEQNRLYNLMARGVEYELGKIEELLGETRPDSPDFKRKLATACVYKAYVKRYCNLMLLKQDDEILNSFDLVSSIRESLDYLRLNRISCNYKTHGDGYFDADKLILAYRIYQYVIEETLDYWENAGKGGRDTLDIDVELMVTLDNLNLRMNISGEGGEEIKRRLSGIEDFYEKDLILFDGSLEIGTSEEDAIVTLVLASDVKPEDDDEGEVETEPGDAASETEDYEAGGTADEEAVGKEDMNG